MDKKEFNSSESRDYMGRPGKGLTSYLDLRIKIPSNKQKEIFSTTSITNQDLKNLLKNLKKQLYLCYNSKHVHNEPTEA